MSLKPYYSDSQLIECGCDEAGRGCLAGPVYAAAVILPRDFFHSQLNDSKQLTRIKREQLREIIIKEAISYSISSISEQIIDKINILNASILGMNEAISQLKVVPELLLIDGNRFHNIHNIPYHCIVKGDATYNSIAAASILAKTFRDEYMEHIDQEYNMYNWRKNKGYPTMEHQNAVLQYGLTPYHRRSFHLKNQLRLDF